MSKSVIEFVHKHGLVAILVLLWSVGVTTYIVLRVFSDNPPEISNGTVAALSAVLTSLLAVGYGFYKWRVTGKDDTDSK